MCSKIQDHNLVLIDICVDDLLIAAHFYLALIVHLLLPEDLALLGTVQEKSMETLPRYDVDHEEEGVVKGRVELVDTSSKLQFDCLSREGSVSRFQRVCLHL